MASDKETGKNSNEETKACRTDRQPATRQAEVRASSASGAAWTLGPCWDTGPGMVPHRALTSRPGRQLPSN